MNSDLYNKLDKARLAAYAELKDDDLAASEFVNEPWNGQVHTFYEQGLERGSIYTYGRRDVLNFTPGRLFNRSLIELKAEIIECAKDAARFKEKSGKYARYAVTA